MNFNDYSSVTFLYTALLFNDDMWMNLASTTTVVRTTPNPKVSFTEHLTTSTKPLEYDDFLLMKYDAMFFLLGLDGFMMTYYEVMITLNHEKQEYPQAMSM